MKFTLAITTMNRFSVLKETLPFHSSIPEIDEIVINDDGNGDYEQIKNLNIPKVKCFKNEKNLGVFRNKMKTLSLASNDWIILLDSDNKLDQKYIDSIKNINLDENVVYCPTFAMPELNYEILNNTYVTKNDFLSLLSRRVYDAAFNTCNFLISKKVANSLLKESEDYISKYNYIPNAHDSVAINYLILKNNFKLYFLKDMHYYHDCSFNANYNQTVKISKPFNEVVKTFEF
jgi:hypothetical protein